MAAQQTKRVGLRIGTLGVLCGLLSLGLGWYFDSFAIAATGFVVGWVAVIIGGVFFYRELLKQQRSSR